MKIKLLKDCRDELPKDVRLMGIDLGSKTIGIAVSDTAQKLATPISTIKRTKFSKDILALGEIIQEFDIEGFIVGWPVNMDGTMGPRCDATLSFVDEMMKRPEIIGLEPFLAFQDERLSTHAVDDFLDKSVNMSRKDRNEIIDKLAAQVILQEALDSLRLT